MGGKNQAIEVTSSKHYMSNIDLKQLMQIIPNI